ncbi:MAG: protein kinase, partial [Planctomycetes bacterium]|nr:protein kinase [Planctomycetota bacterium]
MPKQSDIDFANEVLRQGLATKEAIRECLGVLKGLEDVGMEDSLDGILCLKGHLNEAQVSGVWKEVFARDEDEDAGPPAVFTLEGVLSAPSPTETLEVPPESVEAPAPEAPPPSPAPEPAAAAPAPAPDPAAPEAPARPAEALPEVSGYRLEAKLEKDSTGINYLGTREGNPAKVIVHVLYPQMAADATFMNWLTRWGRRLTKLEHPLLARTFSVQPLGNRACYAQGIPDGEALPSVLEEGPLEEEKALLLLEQIAEVLEEAEAKDVFHGRLTPQNVFVIDGEQVRLRLFTFPERERKLFLGEPDPEDVPFLSPEVRQGRPATVRSDVFSAGKILLRMVGAEGKPARTPSERCRRIVGKMIAMDPAMRYPAAKLLLEDLERYFEGKAIPEGFPSAEPPAETGAKPKPSPEAAPARKPAAQASKAASRPGKPEKAAAEAGEEVPVEAVEEGDEGEGAGRKRKLHPGKVPSGRSTPKKGISTREKAGRDREEERRPASARRPSGGTKIVAKPASGSSRARLAAKAEPAEAEPVEVEAVEVEALEVEAVEVPAAPGKPRPSARAEPAAPEPLPRVAKAIVTAERREEKGDLPGALEALEEALEADPKTPELRTRINALKEKGFAEVRQKAREKEKTGDYKGAIKVFEEGRAFAPDPADVDRVIGLLRERVEESEKRKELGALDAKAQARLDKGDVLGAVAALEEAKRVSDKPLLVQAKIEAVLKKAYEERLGECQEKEKAGDFEGAITAARRARDFAPNKSEADAFLQALEKKREKGVRQAEYRRLEEEALKRAADGNVDGAVEVLERAKKYADSPLAVDARIDSLKHDAAEKHLSTARKLEEQGRFQDAIYAWERARPFVADPEEVEAAIRLLRSKIQEGEKERVLQRMREEASALEAEGKLEEAIAKLLEHADRSGTAAYTTRLKVDELKKSAFDRAMQESAKRKEAGDFDGAVEAVEAARRFAPDERSVDLIVATLRSEKTRGKQADEYRKLEAAAKAKAKAGDIHGSIQILEKAKAFADSPVAVDAKIHGLMKVAFDKHMGEAKEKETAGAWSDALELYRKARDFTEDKARIDEILRGVEREIDRLKKDSAYKRLLGDADALVK